MLRPRFQIVVMMLALPRTYGLDGRHARGDGRPAPSVRQPPVRRSGRSQRQLQPGTGSSVTLNGAINVGGFQAGMTSAISYNVVHRYDNGENRHREICGEKAFPPEDTRITSIA